MKKSIKNFEVKEVKNSISLKGGEKGTGRHFQCRGTRTCAAM